jgi:translation initiation factor IF-2
MNNGKVRIYELSKELNLDNKEILAVCERLAIPFKSHSSTISDAEAELIRTSAMSEQSKSSRTRQLPTPDTSDVTSPSPPRKQQILALHRHAAPVEDSTEALATPQVVAPRKPAQPVRPVKPAAVQSAKPASADPETTKQAEPVVPSPPVAAAPRQPQTPAERPAAAELKRPPAAAEPKRPAAKVLAPPTPELLAKPATPKPAATKAVAVNKPQPQVVKQVTKSVGPKPSTAAAPTPTTPSVEVAAAPPVRPVAKRVDLVEPPTRPVAKSLSTADRPSMPTKPGAVSKAPTKAAPQVLELRRPKVGAPATRTESEAAVLEPPIEAVVIPELMRPTAPPKPARSRKTWEEEDEERQSRKAATKASAKAKRRTQLLDEEDEEEDLLASGALTAEQNLSLSLSLARPPKPKQAQPAAATKPTPTSTPTKKRRGETARERQARRARQDREAQPQRPEILTLKGSMTVQELAEALGVTETEIIKSLFFKGIAATVTQTLDVPTIERVAEEFDVLVEQAVAESGAKKTTEMLEEADMESLQSRPPVVTVMGHVDHGKTTLLDSIRKTKVAAGEAGGITQHIGAYHVDVEHNGKPQQIVFLDTPGHEAFTAMRARGARVTDIAILVVAADDGVRPQTLEAISHAKAAEVPLIVAINKCDKEGAQPDRVKQELTEYGLVPEEWGGETIMVPVSALTGDNLDTLLEMILLVSEVQELVANPNRSAKGTVIEAHLDKARGPVATFLVQNGTLRVGDVLVAGPVLGRVRAMVDDRGDRIEAAGPSFAVEVLGLGDVPAAGDEFAVYTDEKLARNVASERTADQRQSRLAQAMASRRVTLSSLSAQAQEGELKELNILLKADVQGSVEAILGALEQLPQDEVQVRVLMAAPGEVTETDVDLAAASGAVILGFSTTLASGAKRAADEAGVDIREYDVIYKLLEDVQGAMEGLLEPELVEEPLGQVEVRAVFPVGRGSVAGCYVQSGKAIRNCNVRVLRGKEVVYTGTLDSLKRMKEDAKEVAAGYECGIGIDNFNSWELGDIIETYRMVTKRRTLTLA